MSIRVRRPFPFPGTRRSAARLAPLIIAPSVLLLCLAICAPCFAASTVAQRYLHERNAVGSQLLPESSLPAIEADPGSYAGQTVEASGSVVGEADTSTSKLLILQVQNVSVDMAVPASLASTTSWLSTGSVLRVLLRVPTAGQAEEDRSMLRLIAAAPEADVEALERQVAQNEAYRPSEARRFGRDQGFEPSRSATFSTEGLVPGHPTLALSDDALRVYPYYRAAIARFNRRLTDDQIDAITSGILRDSSDCHIDPRLIIAMIIAESGFNPYSTSPKGAMGLGQLMPGTAAGMGVTNAYDTYQNIWAAVHILSGNVDKFGGEKDGVVPLNTLLLTMAAYNAGGGAVAKYHGIPPYRETQRYVRKVATIYAELCSGDSRSTGSDTRVAGQ